MTRWTVQSNRNQTSSPVHLWLLLHHNKMLVLVFPPSALTVNHSHTRLQCWRKRLRVSPRIAQSVTGGIWLQFFCSIRYGMWHNWPRFSLWWFHSRKLKIAAFRTCFLCFLLCLRQFWRWNRQQSALIRHIRNTSDCLSLHETKLCAQHPRINWAHAVNNAGCVPHKQRKKTRVRDRRLMDKIWSYNLHTISTSCKKKRYEKQSIFSIQYNQSFWNQHHSLKLKTSYKVSDKKEWIKARGTKGYYTQRTNNV